MYPLKSYYSQGDLQQLSGNAKLCVRTYSEPYIPEWYKEEEKENC